MSVVISTQRKQIVIQELSLFNMTNQEPLIYQICIGLVQNVCDTPEQIVANGVRVHARYACEARRSGH